MANLEAGTKQTCRRMPRGASCGVYKPPSSLSFSPFDLRRFYFHPQLFLRAPCVRNFIPIPLLYPIIPWYTLYNQHGSRRPWVSPSLASSRHALTTMDSGGDPGALDPQRKLTSFFSYSPPRTHDDGDRVDASPSRALVAI